MLMLQLAAELNQSFAPPLGIEEVQATVDMQSAIELRIDINLPIWVMLSVSVAITKVR